MQVLVADNNDHTRSTICQLLEDEGYDVIPAETAERTLSLVRGGDIPIVILDLLLVGMDGLDLLTRIKRERPACEVIVMTSFPSLETVISAMKLGALDYLVKTGVDFETLVPTVDRAAGSVSRKMRTTEEISALQQEVAQLKQINRNLHQGIRDETTGLYDSEFFNVRFESELERARENRRLFSIVIVQLNPDIFINGDQYQVRAIDGALPSWSRTIQERLRKSDVIARYDDHTLSIILPETGKEGAVLVAECLIQLCDEVTQAVLGTEIEIADLLQVGIATFPDDGESRDRLFDLATGHSEIGSGSIH